jgi:arylsulfatase A-like enzyme
MPCINRGWLWLGAFAVVTLGPGPVTAAPQNVLLLISDDQRPDTISALGNPHIATPHLDRLVREGTVFTHATCANPLCVPSRAELLTGGVSVVHQGQLPNDVPTWPRVMQQAGYDTWYVGKWHTRGRPSTRGYGRVEGLFSSGQRPETPQLDRHGEPVTGYVGWQFQTDAGELHPELGIGLTPNISVPFADAAMRVLEQPHSRPFFLHVNFTAPHDPLFLPPGYEQRYSPAALPLPANFLPEHPFDHGNLRGRDEQLWPWPRTPDLVRDELAVYYAVISHMDAQIGRLLACLDDTGLAQNTLVIFASDHGLAIGSHGLRGKQNMYEHTINVPLIFRGPGIPRGERRNADCYLRDLLPTVCELTGIAAPVVDGRSLVPVLRGQSDAVHPFVIGYFGTSQRMIRQAGWKLIVYPEAGREQLFHLDRDPLEVVDLSAVAEHQPRRQFLKRQLTDWLRERGDPVARTWSE